MKVRYEEDNVTGFTLKITEDIVGGVLEFRVEIANELFFNSNGIIQAYPFPKPKTEAELERERKLVILLS